MARKVVDLTIRLKDGVTGVLSKIGGSMKRVAQGFKTLAIAGVAATTAIVGGLVAVAKAYSDQESVNKKLKDTFDAAGESGAKAVKKWGAWATAIQRVTALGDEEIMNLVTLAKTMGIANDQIADATKGAIGLSKAFGIDMTSAMKMVALATQGEYEMLQRYIPALRAATTEAEKAEIVQTAMARGFKIATGELDTLKGAWAALKGVVGDAMQEIGRVLFGDGGLIAGLEAVKNKIIELTEGGAITRWAEQAKVGLDAVVQTIKILSKGGKGQAAVLKAVGNVIVQAFKSAAITAMEILMKYAPIIGKAIGTGIADLTGVSSVSQQRSRVEKASSFLAARQKYGSKASVERAQETFLKELDKLNEMLEKRGKSMAIGEEEGLSGAFDELESVLETFGKEESKSGKKLTDELPPVVEAATEKGAAKGTEDGIKKALRSWGNQNAKLTGSIYEEDAVEGESGGGMTETEPFRYDVKPETGNLGPFKAPPTGNLSMGAMSTDGFGPLDGVGSGPSVADYLKQIADNTKGGLL